MTFFISNSTALNIPYVFREEMIAADAASPDSRFVELSPAGHLVPYDQPARLAELALEHFASC